MPLRHPPTVNTGNARTGAAMSVLTTLFFMWGFMTVMNDVLIPHLKEVFTLGWGQVMLVQSSFFGAHFLGSVAYYLVSLRGGDPIHRMGYKRGLIAGLLLAGVGSALFIPATYVHAYGFYLVALFVLGLGFTLLQIAANPFVAIIGPADSASSRLNLAQGFNSLGTTLAPLIGGALIFGWFKGDAAVRWPYAFFAALLLLQAAWVWRTALPEPARGPLANKPRALRHRQLRNGIGAIFCYVGAEVAIGSLIISFLGLEQVMGLSHNEAKNYLSIYWGGAMCGRFLGAVALGGRFSGASRALMLAGIGAAMFLLLWLVNRMEGGLGITQLWPFAILVVANVAMFITMARSAAKATGSFALAAIGLLVAAMLTEGSTAMWAILAIGVLNSILWSNIFTLSIAGLGDDTAQGSSLLVMMILGGALVPLAQGALIDVLLKSTLAQQAMQLSFLLPMACYLYIAWFGYKGIKPAPEPVITNPALHT